MAEVVRMVQLSPTMQEGTLVAWRVEVGQRVRAGDVLAEVETDKANMDMEAWSDGVLLHRFVEAGAPVRVGAPMGVVGRPGEDITGLLGEMSGTEAPAGEGVPAVGSWAGGKAAGEAPESSGASSARAPSELGDGRGAAGARVLASPLARRLARESEIEIARVRGSGPGGRVVARDVAAVREVAAAGGRALGMASQAGSVGAARPLEEPPPRPGRRVSLSRMRAAIATNLTAAWQAPAFSLTRDLDVGALLAFRVELNEVLASRGESWKASLTDLVIRAAAIAMREVPELNAGFDGDALVLWESVDVGVAVAVDGGLVTPVVRSAERLGIGEISTRVREMATRARERKLRPEEYTGATFTISNLGMYDVDRFTAVLNPPAAGILAVGRTRREVVVGDEGDFRVAQKMAVTLTCDHRTVDGATGARWLQALARVVEHPAILSL